MMQKLRPAENTEKQLDVFIYMQYLIYTLVNSGDSDGCYNLYDTKLQLLQCR